jgi:hypothetical protein
MQTPRIIGQFTARLEPDCSPHRLATTVAMRDPPDI